MEEEVGISHSVSRILLVVHWIQAITIFVKMKSVSRILNYVYETGAKMICQYKVYIPEALLPPP